MATATRGTREHSVALLRPGTCRLSRQAQPYLEQARGWSLISWPDLTAHIGLELDDDTVEIRLPHALVAVCQYRESNKHIWVGKL